jgi:serine phosphatase RsbU (regulator of sigma subunit)
MPELDGYQVLAEMRADAALRHIPVIVISSVDELDSVVRCIEMGAEDYLPKVFDRVILQARIGACLEKKRLRDKEQLYIKAMEREFAIGRQIQADFLPDHLPQPIGWELAARFHAAREVGGDFYDVFPIGHEHKLGIVIADVSGKGVGAALFMTLFRTLVRAMSNIDMYTRHAYKGADSIETDRGSIAERLQKTIVLVNDYIASTHQRSHMFVTIFFGILDPATGALSYVNGGHPAPAILGADGASRFLEPTGPVVGLFLGKPFKVEHARLGPGDTLFAYTDGVTDAQNLNKEFFSEERLLDELTESAPSADQLVGRLEATLQAYMDGISQFDDVTMLAVRRRVEL